MIINIRGTSGSGKSTLVRKFTGLYHTMSPVYLDRAERKRPIGYVLTNPIDPAMVSPVALLGHYETDCGGCDTITSVDRIFELVRESHADGMHVVFEGLLLSAERKRTQALHEDGLPLTIIALTTDLDECVDSVNQRRREAFERRLESRVAENLVKAEAGHKLLPEPVYKGDVNPKNTRAKFVATKSTLAHLREAGVDVRERSRDTALLEMQEIMRHEVDS